LASSGSVRSSSGYCEKSTWPASVHAVYGERSVQIMKVREERGFTLIEIMITVAVIGVLAAIAIPMYMAHASKARGVEAVVQLQKLKTNARQYFMEHHTFPAALAETLPGDDGTACANTDRRFDSSPKWTTDPTWSALEFAVGERSQFSYHFQATGPTSAHAWAIADPSCNGGRIRYDLYLEGRPDGTVETAIVDPFSKTAASIPQPSP
jgi:prepilin-type N-terminal cleavage/methylation domain-containing protein